MIPILYEDNETNFTSNGIGRLSDIISGTVTEERNGIYECEFSYPSNGRYFSEIKEGQIIACWHDDTKTIQPFEIYGRTSDINGVVTFRAHHISYRLGKITTFPFSASSCLQAFSLFKNKAMGDCPFDFWTDKYANGDFNVDVPKTIKDLLYGEANSVLGVFGNGEYEWDKFLVKFYENRGSDRNVTIRYGKNLTKMDQELDSSEVYNAVAPFYKSISYITDENGNSSEESIVVTLPEGYIIASNINGNTIDHYEDKLDIVPLDLSSEFDNPPTVAALRDMARRKLEQSEAWIINENFTVEFAQLWQNEEFDTYSSLQRLSLCDKVDVINTKVNAIKIKMEVIKVVYDFVREKYTSMELGDPKRSYSDTVMTTIVSATESLIADLPTKGYLESAIDYATELITGGFGGHLIIKTNNEGQPEELLIMDTDDPSTAVNVWRFNLGGLGHSSSGYNGPYSDIALTMDGRINASMITTGVLNAGLIRAGILSDVLGNNWWNLDTGEFHLSARSLDLDIGGTNLILGTKDMVSEGEARWATTPSQSHIDNGIATLIGDSWSLRCVTCKKIGDYLNRSIIVAFDYYIGDNSDDNDVGVILNLRTTKYDSIVNHAYKKITISKNKIPVGEKVRLSVEFLPTGEDYFTYYSGKEYSDDLYISFRINGSAPNGATISRVKAEVGVIPTDWSPAPEDFSDGIEQVNSKYMELETSIDGLTSTVGSIQSDLSGVNEQYSEISQTVDGISSEVSSLQTGLGTLDSNVSRITQTVDGISSTVSSLRKIGATNILLNSRRMTTIGDAKWVVSPNTSKIENEIAYLRGSDDPEISIETACNLTGITGKTIGQFIESSITVSFNVYAKSNADKKAIDVYLLLNPGEKTTSNSYGYAKATIPNTDIYVGKTRRVSVTFDLPDAQAFTFYSGKSYGDDLYIAVRISTTTTNEIRISKIKAEKGIIASEWSPAPEDVDQGFSEVDTKYSSLTQTVDGISADVVSIQQDMTGLSEQYSSISQTADNISLEVASLKSIGGKNLLLETKLMQNRDDGNARWVISPSTSEIANEIAYLKSDGTEEIPVATVCNLTGVTGKKIGDYIGKSLTLSFNVYVRSSSDKPNFTVSLLLNTNPKTTTKNYGYKDLVIPEDDLVVGRTKRVSITFDIVNSSYFTFLSGKTYSDDLYLAARFKGTVTKEIQISRIKLEVGPVATDWTPAPEDVDSKLADKVGEEEIISKINMSPEQIAIESSKISLRGKSIDLASDNIQILSTNGNGETRIYYAPDEFVPVGGTYPVRIGGQRGWMEIGYTDSGIININIGDSTIGLNGSSVTLGYLNYSLIVDSGGVSIVKNGVEVQRWS